MRWSKYFMHKCAVNLAHVIGDTEILPFERLPFTCSYVRSRPLRSSRVWPEPICCSAGVGVVTAD